VHLAACVCRCGRVEDPRVERRPQGRGDVRELVYRVIERGFHSVKCIETAERVGDGLYGLAPVSPDTQAVAV
jgi:hypothetical protein